MTKNLYKAPSYGLYREKDFLLPDFIHCEPLEYRSEKHEWVIEQHLHVHLMQIFLVEAGRVDCHLENESHVLRKGTIIIIPETIQHGFEVTEDIKGLVLTISSTYIETLFQTYPDLLVKFSSVKLLTNLAKHKLYPKIKSLLYSLYEELRDSQPVRELALQHFLSLLLIRLYRFALEGTKEPISSDSRQMKYYRYFERNVRKTYLPQKSIREYAQELNISPIHLNRICRASVGKSALQVVHEFFFLEATKFLKHTEYNISEIAYRLNFEDPAYFSRFFSKLAGCSPKKFREKY